MGYSAITLYITGTMQQNIVKENAINRFIYGPTAKKLVFECELTDIQSECWELVKLHMNKREIADYLGITYSAASSRVSNLKSMGLPVDDYIGFDKPGRKYENSR